MIKTKKSTLLTSFIFFALFSNMQSASTESWWENIKKQPGLVAKAIAGTTLLKIYLYNLYQKYYTTPNADFMEIVHKSNAFEKSTSTKFPTTENRIAVIAHNNIRKQNAIIQAAKNVHPLMHKEVWYFISKFLAHKCEYGTEKEKTLYEFMTPNQFVNRLLTNRPLMFMLSEDQYILRNGTKGKGGFEKIGTDSETAPLILENYLSYDEMQIAALLGVSTPTYFINNGRRNNNGIKDTPKSFEEYGIYVGLVGARFEKPNVMEWQHMIITPEQNTQDNGYGKNGHQSPQRLLLNLWAGFYGIDHFPTYEEAEKDTTSRFIKIQKNHYLDSMVYKKCN